MLGKVGAVSEIDPIEYGRLIQAVEELQRKVGNMDTDIKKLLELANQSRGGFWVGMSIASFVGGILTFLGTVFFKQH